MNRREWRKKININQGRLPWSCPYCDDSPLKLEKGSYCEEMPAGLKKMIQDGEWGYPEETGFFFCKLRCPALICHEVFFVTGKYQIDIVGEDEGKPIYLKMHLPKLFIPSLPIIKIPGKCPDSVRQPIKDSFALYWVDQAAAVNKLRVAVERFLDARRIKRYDTSKKRKRYRLSLDKRIELYKEREPNAHRLTAIKWLGNEGSHRAISPEAALDAYELLEVFLADVYVPTDLSHDRLAKAINKKKGPIR